MECWKEAFKENSSKIRTLSEPPLRPPLQPIQIMLELL